VERPLRKAVDEKLTKTALGVAPQEREGGREKDKEQQRGGREEEERQRAARRADAG
jgi:hypothetical protein